MAHGVQQAAPHRAGAALRCRQRHAQAWVDVQNLVQDLKGHLRRGVALEELWRVARGELRYADWVQRRAGGNGAAAPAAPPAPSVPQELVNVQAYLLWEQVRGVYAGATGSWVQDLLTVSGVSHGVRHDVRRANQLASGQLKKP